MHTAIGKLLVIILQLDIVIVLFQIKYLSRHHKINVVLQDIQNYSIYFEQLFNMCFDSSHKVYALSQLGLCNKTLDIEYSMLNQEKNPLCESIPGEH